MKNFDTMKDARRVAREVLAGTMDPHLGCGLIGSIGEKLNHHPALMEFIHIAHLLEGPGHVGFTKESLLPDIMAACREFAAVQA
jgi:hypothetical protein